MAGTGRLAARVIGAMAILVAVLTGLGLLITKVLEDNFPLSQEDDLERSIEAARTPAATAVSGFFSLIGSTAAVIGVMVVCMVVLRLVFKRWREALALLLAVSMQAFVFLCVTLLIARQRPEIERLDSSPPTSSFPSGHTGAATALYAGLAVILAWHLGSTWVRRSVVFALLLIPFSVALARIYRGMHHPSDVLASYLNGGACVAFAARTLLFRALPEGLARRLDGARSDAGVRP